MIYNEWEFEITWTLFSGQRAESASCAGRIIQWSGGEKRDQRGTSHAITTRPSSCLWPIWPDYLESTMASLCWYCKLHNCIWTDQEINLSPPCQVSVASVWCVVSSKCDINGARVINYNKSRHNDSIEPSPAHADHVRRAARYDLYQQRVTRWRPEPGPHGHIVTGFHIIISQGFQLISV